jgi:hypothetical protein
LYFYKYIVNGYFVFLQVRRRGPLMGMPPQLARARRPKRSTPRPLVEELPRLEIADLCRYGAFPSQYEWNASYLLELPFRYPFLKNLVISLQNIEANHHTGYTQTIPLRSLRTGFGGNSRPRPLFVCQCGRSVRRVYFKAGHLACRRCQGAIYASQVCDKHSRPILQAKRLRSFLELKSYMRQSNRQRLQERLPIKQLELVSKRIDDRTKLPQGNYSTRGAMHWR